LEFSQLPADAQVFQASTFQVFHCDFYDFFNHHHRDVLLSNLSTLQSFNRISNSHQHTVLQ
jgi:hypothetical protein